MMQKLIANTVSPPWGFPYTLLLSFWVLQNPARYHGEYPDIQVLASSEVVVLNGRFLGHFHLKFGNFPRNKPYIRTFCCFLSWNKKFMHHSWIKCTAARIYYDRSDKVFCISCFVYEHKIISCLSVSKENAYTCVFCLKCRSGLSSCLYICKLILSNYWV